MSMLPAIINGGEKALAKTGGSALSKVLTTGASNAVKNIAIKDLSKGAEKVSIDLFKNLFRGQKLGNDDFYYNKGNDVLKAKGRNAGSATVGNGLYFTPNKNATEAWRGDGLEPIQIKANSNDILKKNDLIKYTDWANEKINDSKYMSNLWATDPDKADFVENLSMGRLPEVSQYLGKPFIEPNSGQGEELSEIIFFPDTNKKMTRGYQDQLKLASLKEGDSIKFTKDLGIKRTGGNFGHKGVKGMRGGSAPKLDQETLDLIETLSSVGADVDELGNVTVFHRTSPENAMNIYNTGKMFGKEADGGLYFSTNRDFQPGYGEAVVKAKIPASSLTLDDIFDNNADLKYITGKANIPFDIRKYLLDK